MTLLLEEPTAQDDQNAPAPLQRSSPTETPPSHRVDGDGSDCHCGLCRARTHARSTLESPGSSVGATAHPVWPPDVRTGATLVYAFNDLRILDADSGATQVLPLPAPYGGSRDLAMVTVGHSFLLNRGNTAWLYS